jgi:alanyl-tRNA synthetase
MTTQELRKQYLDFFQSKGHKLFASDSLVPKNDPTLLFTSAGMNQFKDYFLGKRNDVKRATSCQKCLRTGDLERVGQTAYHHTFFEMLGNFSFGDYFKKEAITWAWEFITGLLNLKEKDLWITVYNDDDEALTIWRDIVGVPADKIVKLGAHDNFWPQNALEDGPNGPCGPCSEIYFDRGSQFGEGNPGTNSKRFVEFWNLVFTQFNRIDYNKTEPLPAKNIDTGMGLERMASILQGKLSNFEIDIIEPLMRETKQIIKSDSVLHLSAISDHARAVTFSIADGIYPSNEDRGYVVRKILRRAVWFAFVNGKKGPFLYKLVDLVVDLMKGPYPEIAEKKDTITKVVRAEEERFLLTLDKGREVVFEYIDLAKKDNRDTLSGEECFKLYDTYGFPCDLTAIIVKQEGLNIDKDGFNKFLAKQKESSRQSSKFEGSVFAGGGSLFKGNTKFVGYDAVEAEAKVLALIAGGMAVEKYDGQEEIAVVLDKTPFYPAQGGQAYDKGFIVKDTAGSFSFEVLRVEKAEGVIFHWGTIKMGNIAVGDNVNAAIEAGRRNAIKRAHTSTHLLQAALRKIIGSHIQQQGSFVDEDCFRFDFNHFKGLTGEDLSRVESEVNEYIAGNIRVNKQVMDFKEAKAAGALAFFEEKYEDKVRVITIGEVSRELCGGTHLDNTVEAQLVVLTGEGSVSSGIRRIEALTGKKACEYLKAGRVALDNLGRLLKSGREHIEKAVADLAEKNKACEKSISRLKKEIFEKITVNDILAKNKFTLDKLSVIIFSFPEDAQALRGAIDVLKKKSGAATIFSGYIRDGGKLTMNLSRGDDLKEINCKELAASIAAKFGGSGGGKEQFGFCGFKLEPNIDDGRIRDTVLECVKNYFLLRKK